MLRCSILFLAIFLTGCSLDGFQNEPETPANGEIARVVQVIDGDTISVAIGADRYRVRYIGINAPERDEVCYSEALRANRDLVENQLISLVRDVSDTDQFGRLLRYVYVDEVFVNEKLVANGWAEVVRYPPDTQFYDRFRDLQLEAAQAGRGCHLTGIFDDGSLTR